MKILSNKNSSNRFFYFGRDGNYVKWNDCRSIEKSYWTAVLKNIASQFEIIITENSKYLPKYGNDVVVILKSDEFTSNIEYTTRVKAIFRNYSDKKYFHSNNIFFLPLPYLGKINKISPIPFLDREIDIFFAGQIIHSSRKKLSRVVQELKKRRKDLNIVFHKTQKFFSGWSVNQYLNNLSNSKISLCPRGASMETYRHFESLCLGCVTISTPLPDVWYFKDAPVRIIKRWNELPVLLDELIIDQNLLEEISKKSVEYWNDKLSPEAVAKYIDNSINSLN